MKKWVFFGRVLPERLPLKLSEAIKGTCAPDVVKMSYEFDIAIADGQVVVNISITEGNTDLFTLRNLVESNIRSITDVIGYLEGLSFDIDMISAASLDTGDRCIFGTAIPVVQDQRRKSGAPRALPGDLLQIVCRDPHAQIVLADFREAMRVPVGTGFFCYRAIEAMMQSMKWRDDENEKAAWPRVRRVLRIDRAPIEYVKDHSDIPRHGKPANISDEQRAKVFMITDEVIRRFLAYLIRGKTELPEAEFPEFRI
jgi:hypothetical protein